MLRNGLIPKSFIPPREIRELGDLNRTRRKDIEIMASEKNRLQKVLEDANIKLGSVVSKIDGKSSMKMIQSLLEKDELSREKISEMARRKLKGKVPQLIEALNGRVTEHHRFPLRFHFDNIAFQLEQIQELDEEIQRRMVPFQKEYHLIQPLPGIGKTLAAE